jgi:arylsulfatase A-like enzyme
MRLRAHLQSVRALCIATAAIGLYGISTAQGKAKSPSIASQRPDVVFIVVDDLNDWIGAMHGHPQSLTPNLDAFAKRGVLFTNAHCNAPQCLPSRKSFLSGLYPKSTGIYFNSKKRPPFFGTQPTSGKTSKARHETIIDLHQHFLNNDYRVVSGGKVASYAKPDADLDSYLRLQTTSKRKDTFTDDRTNLWGDGGPQNLMDAETGDHRVAQWAIKEWNTKTDKPLFMSVGFYRPHRPLNAPKAYFDKFPPKDIALPALPDGDDWDDMPEYATALARSHAHRPFHHGKYSDHEEVLRMGGEDEWKYMVSSYLACVNYVDAQIGLVLDALKVNPRERETLIVLTSDHGWHLGEKRHWCKGAIWNDTTNVPFIVVAPGLSRPGTTNNQPISLVDLYPTLCDYAGLTPPKHLEGKSILPLIKDPRAKRRHAFLSYGPENTAVQTETMRYIRYENGSEELYDHENDPHEWTNLASSKEHHDVKMRLREQAIEFQNR